MYPLGTPRCPNLTWFSLSWLRESNYTSLSGRVYRSFNLQSISLYLYLSALLFIHPSIHPSYHLIHLYIYLSSKYISIHLSISIYLSILNLSIPIRLTCSIQNINRDSLDHGKLEFLVKSLERLNFQPNFYLIHVNFFVFSTKFTKKDYALLG